jgi:Flp pilus assembly protein CpaB
MNQKNIILLGVALGFGVMAMILFQNMNAKEQVVAPPAEIEVPVAVKDVPINTKLVKEEIDQYVVMKKFARDRLPPGDYATSIDELLDKRVTRTVRTDELFAKADLSTKPLVVIPPGYSMMTFGVNREKIVGGFALPGSKVDVIATVRLTKLNKSVTFPLFRDMLILAVDVNPNPPPGQTANQTASDVSVAVTKEDALMLHAAINRGADFRLLLLGQGKPDETKEYEKIYTKDEIWQILTDEYGTKQKDEVKEEPKFETVELPVPTEDLPAGTELTEDLINTKFTVLPIKPPAPANVIKDIRDHTGRFLIKDLAANQYVPRNYVADAMPKKPEPTPAPIAPVMATEKPAPKPVEEPKAPPVYHDVLLQTSTGVRKFRYQKMEDGTYRYKGEVKIEEDDDKLEPTPAKKPDSVPAAEPHESEETPKPPLPRQIRG